MTRRTLFSQFVARELGVVDFGNADSGAAAAELLLASPSAKAAVVDLFGPSRRTADARDSNNNGSHRPRPLRDDGRGFLHYCAVINVAEIDTPLLRRFYFRFMLPYVCGAFLSDVATVTSDVKEEHYQHGVAGSLLVLCGRHTGGATDGEFDMVGHALVSVPPKLRLPHPAGGEARPSMDDWYPAYLEGVAVSPAVQGRGVAAALVRHVASIVQSAAARKNIRRWAIAFRTQNDSVLRMFVSLAAALNKTAAKRTLAMDGDGDRSASSNEAEPPRVAALVPVEAPLLGDGAAMDPRGNGLVQHVFLPHILGHREMTEATLRTFDSATLVFRGVYPPDFVRVFSGGRPSQLYGAAMDTGRGDATLGVLTVGDTSSAPRSSKL